LGEGCHASHQNSDASTPWYQNVSSLDFIGAKDDGGGGDDCSHKTCKAPVSQNVITNEPTPRFFYRPDALPVAQPTVSEHWRENKDFRLTNKNELVNTFASSSS